VPIAGIANLVSYNYMTYYNQKRKWNSANSCTRGN